MARSIKVKRGKEVKRGDKKKKGGGKEALTLLRRGGGKLHIIEGKLYNSC